MLFSLILLATSLSLDALGVGVAYGLRKIKIPLASKLIICLFSILYSAAALLVGKSLSAVLPTYISKFLGVAILTCMGLWIIIQAVIRKPEDPESELKQEKIDITLFKIPIKSLGITIQVVKNPIKGDIDKSGYIDKGESLLLGFALSVDAIGVGIGSGLAGLHSMVIPVVVGLFQLGFLYFGLFIGKKVSLYKRINTKVLSILPGALLLLLAVVRII